MRRVVFGGGIAALTHAWLTKTPVFYSHLTPPQLCTDLLDTPTTRSFLWKSLGINAADYHISHKVFWEGKFLPWPGTPESNEAYLRKTRLTDEKPNGFYADKAAIECGGLMPLGQLFFELFQRLKMHGLIHQRHSLRIAQLADGTFAFEDDRSVQFDEIDMAMPPDFLGFRPTNPEEAIRILDTDVFKTTGCTLPVKYLYVPDASVSFFRAIRLSFNMVYVESTKEACQPRAPHELIRKDLVRLMGDDRIELIGLHSAPGYYNRTYDLPKGISLVGRAATGKPLATHHLIEHLKDTFA